MKLESEEIQTIAQAVVIEIKPFLREAVASLLLAKKEKGEILDIQEVADYLKVKKQWVYEKVHRREIPHFHVGKFPRFRKDEIDKFLEGSYTPDQRIQ